MEVRAYSRSVLLRSIVSFIITEKRLIKKVWYFALFIDILMLKYSLGLSIIHIILYIIYNTY